MTTKEILIAARAKVAQGWTQNVFARAENGGCVSALSPHACMWCLEGAIDAAGNCFRADAYEAMRRVVGVGLVGWNDAPGRTHAEVLAAFDKAIEACQ